MTQTLTERLMASATEGVRPSLLIEATEAISELQSCMRDLLAYVENPAERKYPGSYGSGVYGQEPSAIEVAQKKLDDLQKKSLVIMRARRLSDRTLGGQE